MMRHALFVCVVLLFLVPAATAAPLVRELPLNVKVKGSVEEDGGVDTYVFDAMAGLELKIILKGKGGKVLPVLDLIDPLGQAVSVPAPSSSGKTKLKNHLVTTTGRYALRVAVTRAGAYVLKLKADAAKLDEDVVVPAGGTGELVFECLADTKVKIKASEGEKNGPAPQFSAFMDPDDQAVDTDYVKNRSSGFKTKVSSTAKEGEYRLVLGLENGAAGTARVKVKLSDPPKAGTLREEDLLSAQLEKIRSRGPDAAEEYYFYVAVLDTGSIETVTLEIPGRDARPLERTLSVGQFRLVESFSNQASLDADFPDGTYVVRIQREDEDVDQTLSFTVSGDYPSDPLATSPSDGFVGASLAPTVTWSGSVGASGYDALISREGLGNTVYEFTTDDPTETSCDVMAGLLVDGPVYLLSLSARADGLKTSQRSTRFSTSSTGMGYADPEAEKQLVRRPGVSFSFGENDYHFAFTSHFTGRAVRSAQLEYLSTNPIAVANFTPVAGSADFDLNLRWEIPRGLVWAQAVEQTRFLMPDGDYRFRITYIDGTEVVTDPISVGGRPHEFGTLTAQGTNQGDGKPVNVLTPSWTFKQDEDDSSQSERTYRFVVEEPATGEVAYEEVFDVTRTAPADFLVEAFTVPDGMLQKKREYRLTLISSNGEGWSTRVWTTFTTGSDQNTPAFASIAKERWKNGDGEEKFVFLAELGGVTIDRARVRDPQGNRLVMDYKGGGLFRLKIQFDTEADLDQALPDGTYELDLEYDDGTPDQLRRYSVTGDYPAFPEILTPTHGEKKVAKDPGIAWAYSAEDADVVLSFYARITDRKKDVIVFARSLKTSARDTKVPSTAKLRSGKKQELEVYALGPTRKNSRSSLIFKTK